MSWQSVSALLAGTLLILPMVSIIMGRRPGGWLVEKPESPRLSPKLSNMQRRQLVTWNVRCRTSADCEPPLGCFLDSRYAERSCQDSECKMDLDCGPGRACRTFYTLGKGPYVRVCVMEGTQAEGEPCDRLPHDKESACQPGLLCYGRCGRRCNFKDPSSCPPGFTCTAGFNGGACMPTCKEGTCPKGQECLKLRGILSCVVLRSQDCRKNPCPEGQHCAVYSSVRGHETEVHMECLTPCKEDGPPCADGKICMTGDCRQLCAPNKPDTCGPGRECQYLEEAHVCMPR